MKTIIKTITLLLLLLLPLGFAGCSEDDENGRTDEAEVEINDSSLVGKWTLIRKHGGFSEDKNYDNGFYNLEFDSKSVKVQASKEATSIESFLLKSGIYEYIISSDSRTLTIGEKDFYFFFEKGILNIDTGSAYDAPVYEFKKMKRL